MPRTIKFHLDEHVDNAVALGLNRRGVDVTTTAAAGLGGTDDHRQLDYCRQSGRVVYTNDPDFLRLHALDPNHAGIVYAHQQRVTIVDAIRGLMLIRELLEPGEMAGRVEYF